ncbi:hypothetical protein [Kibdelosporangium phytohabitans]|uniref:hypothetical protein n=1 Tax=Kibdelosporangium phytohabitans TaxID=860235 RepID=UPI0012F7E978|nr:hypothetical protein [Kibdelosporangium phytohabitans]MBE1469243.1 hypothetical protein [Kibdelosporangium phytohabitans]
MDAQILTIKPMTRVEHQPVSNGVRISATPSAGLAECTLDRADGGEGPVALSTSG